MFENAKHQAPRTRRKKRLLLAAEFSSERADVKPVRQAFAKLILGKILFGGAQPPRLQFTTPSR
jgi:hypothetical protein